MAGFSHCFQIVSAAAWPRVNGLGFGMESKCQNATAPGQAGAAGHSDLQERGLKGVSGYEFVQHVARNVSQPEVSSAVAVSQFGVINAQEVEDCRMNVMNVGWFSTALNPKSSVAP